MEQIVTMRLVKRRELLFAAFGLPAFSVAVNAGMGTAYSARLIGGETEGGSWRAGVDLALAEGWKTYWRVPGDAGVPPEFNWSRSRNVQTATMLWPAPRRFTDESGETIGYRERVVFPVNVVPKDPSRPIDLALDAFLGVCEKICIPVKLDLSLVQSQPVPADVSLIAAFTARVPQKISAKSPFHVARARLTETDGKFDLALALEGRGFDRDLDIFVEGSEFVYFRKPRPASEEGLVLLRVDGLKDARGLKGRSLTLTMTAGDIRLEQDVVVD
jgi:DsbC/DsbD-like thiol-disulfide interchange protein